MIRRALSLWVAVAGAWCASAPCDARPLYAARTGRACSSCHVDPAGGGVRSGTGFRYALNLHSLAPDQEREPILDPRIADGIRIGADVRTQYLQDASNATRARSTFFQMQAALYLAADLNDRLGLVYATEQGRTLEVFALVRDLPLDGTLKIGRFRPAFGLEEEDHTAFTRDRLGFGNGSEDTGVELSSAHRSARAQIAVLNGAPGLRFDDNAQKRMIGRLWWQPGRAGIGLSGAAGRPGSALGEARRESLYGVFGHLGWRDAVLLVEIDFGDREADDGSTRGIAAALAEASILVHPRIAAKTRYDRFDPDRGVGDDARDRIAAGFEADLLPFTRLLGFVRLDREEGRDEQGRPSPGETRETIEILGQLHLSF